MKIRDAAILRMIHVERTGPLVTVQDLGRPGWGHLGVSRSGAADRAALRRANRLVGNAETAAGLEILAGGAVIRAVASHLVMAVSGAECPLFLDGRPVARDAVLDLAPGGRLVLGTAAAGLRAYLAVRGGVDVPPVLGSRSRDTLAGLGPDPVLPGTDLPVGGPRSPAIVRLPCVDLVPAEPLPEEDEIVTLRAVPGPRAGWFDDASQRALQEAEWQVTPDADRVGLRLEGPELRRAAAFATAELPSEGLVRGAVQVPPNGRPVLFLADHPVTGGYPVAAVVLDADVDRAAQLRPGQRLRLVPARRPVRRSGTGWWAW